MYRYVSEPDCCLQCRLSSILYTVGLGVLSVPTGGDPAAGPHPAHQNTGGNRAGATECGQLRVGRRPLNKNSSQSSFSSSFIIGTYKMTNASTKLNHVCESKSQTNFELSKDININVLSFVGIKIYCIRYLLSVKGHFHFSVKQFKKYAQNIVWLVLIRLFLQTRDQSDFM